MKKLRSEDLAWCVKRLPRKVEKVLRDFSCNVTIGGGYIRSCITGDTLKDIDLFVNSEKTAQLINDRLKKEDQRTFKTKNAYTIFRGQKPPIQVIKRWLYNRPENVLDDLDFTICCASIWYENGKFRSAIHNSYYADLAAKRLRYTEPSRIEEAGGSLLRVLKYYNKGYRIMLTSFAKTIARCMMSVEDLEFKRLSPTGSDNSTWTKEKQLAKIINGLLVEVDPNAIGEDDFVRDAENEEETENKEETTNLEDF